MVVHRHRVFLAIAVTLLQAVLQTSARPPHQSSGMPPLAIKTYQLQRPVSEYNYNSQGSSHLRQASVNGAPPNNFTSAGPPRNNRARWNDSNDRTNAAPSTRILTPHPDEALPSDIVGEEIMFGDEDIIFPDSFDEFEAISKVNSEPNCAQGNTYCEDVAGYPYKRVKNVLKQAQEHSHLFGTDEVPILNRIGEPEENFFCRAIDRMIYPQAGKTKNNKWKYIINQGDQDGYIQGVRVETCWRENTPCDLIGNLPNGYVTSCKQKYIYRRMLSLNDNLEPVPDTFQMPSACCCSYKRDIGYLRSFGRHAATPAKKRR